MKWWEFIIDIAIKLTCPILLVCHKFLQGKASLPIPLFEILTKIQVKKLEAKQSAKRIKELLQIVYWPTKTKGIKNPIPTIYEIQYQVMIIWKWLQFKADKFIEELKLTNRSSEGMIALWMRRRVAKLQQKQSCLAII